MSTRQWIDENFGKELSATIFKLKIDLPNGKKVIHDFSVDASVDYDLLEEQLTETPSQHAFLSAVLAEQRHTCAKLERLIARRRATISQNATETAKIEGLKMAQWMLEELVEADDKILELQSKLMLEQRTLSKLYGFVETIKMKNDNLRTLAGFKKEEMRQA